MFRRDESGYSIVEVMVAILILMAAILPMFKMFDVSLQTAMRSSDYDRARALAEKQTEIAQSVSFDSLKTAFPKCNDAAVPTPGPEANCKDAAYPNLVFSINKSYVESSESGGQVTLGDVGGPTNMIKVIIEVERENDPRVLFKTVGVVANDG